MSNEQMGGKPFVGNFFHTDDWAVIVLHDEETKKACEICLVFSYEQICKRFFEGDKWRVNEKTGRILLIKVASGFPEYSEKEPCFHQFKDDSLDFFIRGVYSQENRIKELEKRIGDLEEVIADNTHQMYGKKPASA